MKQLLSIALMAMCLNLNAQIKEIEIPKKSIVGKIKKGFETYGELSYSIMPSLDTLYSLYYKDVSFTTISEFKFVYFKNDAIGLYNMLCKAMDKDKGGQTMFKIGEYTFTVLTSQMLGAKYLIMSISSNGIRGVLNLTPKELDKLFGIKKPKEPKVFYED